MYICYEINQRVGSITAKDTAKQNTKNECSEPEIVVLVLPRHSCFAASLKYSFALQSIYSVGS